MSRYDYWKGDTPDRFEDEPRPVLLDGPEEDTVPDPNELEMFELPDDPDDDVVPQPDPADLDRFVDDGGVVADPPGGEG